MSATSTRRVLQRSQSFCRRLSPLTMATHWSLFTTERSSQKKTGEGEEWARLPRSRSWVSTDGPLSFFFLVFLAPPVARALREPRARASFGFAFAKTLPLTPQVTNNASVCVSAAVGRRGTLWQKSWSGTKRSLTRRRTSLSCPSRQASVATRQMSVEIAAYLR